MKILFELSLSIILEYTVVEGMDVRLRAFPKSDIFYDKGHMLKKECIYKFIIWYLKNMLQMTQKIN
jgi:hypothetical protein